jgi:hypothetical protein
MDMVTPPVVDWFPAEVCDGMIEGDGGLFDDDKTMEGTCFMTKAPLRS